MQEQALLPVWGIVANIVRERPYGPEGKELRSGTKHFAPGAKVTLLDFYWGMGLETPTVVGRHRRSHRYITLAIRTKWLVNWRTELIYSPFIIDRILKHPWSLHIGRRPTETPYLEWLRTPEAKIKYEELIESIYRVFPELSRPQPFTTRSKQAPEAPASD